MSELPQPVTTAIIRGMAAYLQSARPTDLPPRLRPLRGKHLKMMTARKGDVFDALGDDALRAQVLDWLEDQPTGISRTDADILLIAVRREGEWEKELVGKAPAPKKKATPSPSSDAVLQREKDRTRKAKEEARRTKQSSAAESAAHRKEIAALSAEIDRLEQKLKEVTATVVAARTERDVALAQMDREVRKARRRAEKAEAALEESKTLVKKLRADLTKTNTPRAPSKRTRSPAAAPADKEPSRRRRLVVPKGRYEDAPETLIEWLSTPQVHLLVDGYNVSKAEGGFGDLRLEGQRTRLLQEVGRLARKHKIKATVIFDGSEIAPGTSRRARGPVEVEYSRAGEIADDHLIAKLEGLPKYPVIVATNDRELQRRAARLGATIASSNQLLAVIR